MNSPLEFSSCAVHHSSWRCRSVAFAQRPAKKSESSLRVIASSGEWRSEHSAHGDYPGALNIATSGTLPRSLFEAQLAQRSGKGSPAPEIPEVPEVTIPAAPSELGGALQ